MRAGPQVYSIAAHRGFADALVAGLIPRYREDGFGLARLTLLLPSRRAVRAVTEAFVRASGGALMLPRMAVVGDLDLDETLGPLVDPLPDDAGGDIPPAVDPTLRLLILADLLRIEVASETPDHVPGEAALLRLARGVAETIDRLLVEEVTPERLLDPAVIGLVGDLAEHWKDSTRLFAKVLYRWRAELDERGACDAPERRNRLLRALARRWRETPPAHPVVAAGVTSAAPAVAHLLRCVADLPGGAIILPDLDLALDQEVWDALGHAGAPADDGAVFGRGDIVTHPQYHLKLLLNRMGIARDEVQAWHRAGPSAAPPARSRAISNLFLPPVASAIWARLPSEDRSLAGVRIMTSAHPGEESLAIAALVRRALEQPERRVALVTPDRGLAERVIGHLQRWNVGADDSAGRPLPQTAAGRLLLALAECWAERAAPVPLIALLGHPLVRAGEGRALWLDRVRRLDLALRGPRPGPGLDGVGEALQRARYLERDLIAWWESATALLAPLLAHAEPLPLADALAHLVEAAERLCGEAIWAEADGRALAAFVEDWSGAAGDARLAGVLVDPAELPALLRDAIDQVAVRPPYGGHSRLAIYGLLEARMNRADLVICAGLNEGTWPTAPSADPVLAPAVLRALGIPGPDFRIGLAAHDFAAALGSPEVVLSHALRDAAGPAVPSRFLLRIRAMLGQSIQTETAAIEWASALDQADPVPHSPRPRPMPSAEQRRVDIAATALDRLRGDPYQFYASAILRLSSLDPLDADPTPAWRGTAVHAILEAWHKAGAPPGQLIVLAREALDAMSAHPLMRALWTPRLIEALEWIEEEQARLAGEGRTVAAFEQWGDITVRGVKIKGRADRIDRLPDGTLAIVDYKTGSPPSPTMVAEGFALQLGLIGLIAERDGFANLHGKARRFEYWSLSRRRDGSGFGWCREPVHDGKGRSGVLRDEFLPLTDDYLHDALDRWILGSEPFTARLNPNLPGYSDYDQLMRLDEWQGREGEGA
ncbi:helicase [Novosphingobium nitrogenifigens DSM 19370]|uniref:Helicase n=1 Tax=Novosphingobium nitrogenifigens DSM 19370 TaxID=983920 RepID=F1Z9Q9_9SPHN|nr:double-strand break repair protein AddB [Novosphingobium nitrogenifigens]EGD58683.1 helicase [Novosphingobium nitrogenifigens DSM 19370]